MCQSPPGFLHFLHTEPHMKLHLPHLPWISLRQIFTDWDFHGIFIIHEKSSPNLPGIKKVTNKYPSYLEIPDPQQKNPGTPSGDPAVLVWSFC